MRVLLVGPDQEENLSVRYLASSLRQSGHDVEMAAFNSTACANEVVRKAVGFDMVGLSLAFQSRAREFLDLARRLKAKGVPLVVAGGHYASCAADEILEQHPEIDVIAIHEGEETIVELADAGTDRGNWAKIRGTVFNKDGVVHRTAPRAIRTDLDALPFPDRRGKVQLFAGVPTTYMLGSRGCLANCDYCCITTLHRLAPGPRFRRRQPEQIAEEMGELYHERGIRQFIFHDDNFLVPSVRANHERLDALEKAWASRGIRDIGLVLKCRPGDVEETVFARLKQMGLLRVFLGIESASSAGLASIGRQQTIEDSEQALRICRELEVSAQYTIMCFHPDATVETVRSDIDFMRRHIDHPLNFCRTETYAGTPLERRMIDEGRARGSYLARTYTINDPVVELASSLAKKVFLARCWSTGGLMERAIGLDHLGAVVGHFYADRESTRLRGEIQRWRLQVNRDLVELLSRLVETCVTAGGNTTDPSLIESVRELVDQEARTRRQAISRGQDIWQAISDYFPERVGLRRDKGLRPVLHRRATGLARHAAAVALAMSAAGAFSCGVGISEYAPPPLEDTDHDGLPDRCETEIFGTDPSKEDTDDNGIPDGDEDHDNDGMTNLEEQNVAGDRWCEDIEP